MISLKKYVGITIGGVLVITALSSFIYFTTGEDLSPGWTSPVKIQDDESLRLSFQVPLITYHGGELWIAFYGYGEKRRAIKVAHSKDGEEWSSPLVLVEESSIEHTLSAFQWLERPDGSLWLLWTESKSEDQDKVLSYAALDDYTWTPQKIHRLDRTNYIERVENAPGGGLVVLIEHEGESGCECSVQSSNEHFEWNPPYVLSMWSSSGCCDVLFDRNGTLWAIFNEGLERTSFRTSRDGNTWSSSQEFPLETKAGGIFLQRTSGQFVFILAEDLGSRFVSFSQDGLEWSRPTLIVRTNKYLHFDVTESADSILWGVFEVDNVIYLTKYSDQKYYEDLYFLRNLRIKNEAIFFSICLLIITSSFLLRMGPIHALLKENPHYLRVEKHIQKVQKNMRRVVSWVVFGIDAFMIILVLGFSFPNVNMVPILMGYSALFWMLLGFIDPEDEKSIEKRKKYGKIIRLLCVIAMIALYVLNFDWFTGHFWTWAILLLMCSFSTVILDRS